MQENEKRLFFAASVKAPWPENYPKGRLIEAESRHETLAFLGNVPYPELEAILPEYPKPTFKVAPSGYFSNSLFLPEAHPHVVAWHVEWDRLQQITKFQKELAQWLRDHHYFIDRRDFLSHVTIARSPFDRAAWMRFFSTLPCIMGDISLFESVGNLIYRPIWTHPLIPPFVEISHTADLAFLIQAESIESLCVNAQAALAFKAPELLQYLDRCKTKISADSTLEDLVIRLNQLITLYDSESHCPLKAVSFHGDLLEEKGILKWEMIVDV